MSIWHSAEEKVTKCHVFGEGNVSSIPPVETDNGRVSENLIFVDVAESVYAHV